MMEIKPKIKVALCKQSIVTLFTGMGKYYGISSIFCGAEQEYLIDEVIKYRNDQYSLVSGGSQIQALMYDLRQHNFLLPSVSEGFSFPKSWTPNSIQQANFLYNFLGYQGSLSCPHWEEKEINHFHRSSPHRQAPEIPGWEASASEITRRTNCQGPQQEKGQRKLFPFIFGVRKREVAISGLHCLHRENLEPLRIEDPTQESRDKWHTASLVPTGPTGHSVNRTVGEATAASNASKQGMHGWRWGWDDAGILSTDWLVS